MSWSDLFKKESIAATVEAFNDHGTISLCNQVLSEEPDNHLVKTIKESLINLKEGRGTCLQGEQLLLRSKQSLVVPKI